MTTHDPYESVRDWIPETRSLLIDGREVVPEGNTWEVVNPATEVEIAQVAGASIDQVDQAVQAARGAFGPWSQLSGEEREAGTFTDSPTPSKKLKTDSFRRS